MQAALGVFDSGLGGLTVVKELRRAYPGLKLIYLGDTARVPYGIRSEETLHRYLAEGCAFLETQGVGSIVLACNTLSSLLPVASRNHLIGVIEPGALAAHSASKTRKIGLIGTEATIRSQAYEKALHKIDASIQLLSVPAPLLVPLIEEGWLAGKVPELVVDHYLAPLLNQGIDTLILGCTHYPILRTVIENALQAHGISIIDSGSALASVLATFLPEISGHPASALGDGFLEAFVTDAPHRFDEIATRFLGGPLDKAQKITL